MKSPSMSVHSGPKIPMQLMNTVSELRDWVKTQRQKQLTIGFVPTMGALHQGHLSLIERASQNADVVVVSIFVNPNQFAPNEDFDSYPRELEEDIQKLTQTKCVCVFAPAANEIYPEGFATSISLDAPITKDMEGAARPGFFDGVAIVVVKLLMQVMADIAVFGEKDYQQLQMVRQLAKDLDIPTEIVGAPIIRDENGLALSSRNSYLSKAQYTTACQLNKILAQAITSLKKGDEVEATLDMARQMIMAAGFDKLDYLELRHAETLEEIKIDKLGPANLGKLRLLATARIGDTRLLDNMAI